MGLGSSGSGQLIAVQSDLVGNPAYHPTTSREYDDFGRLITIYPPNYYNPPDGATGSNFIVQMQYDFHGRLIQRITPDAGTSKFMYDRAGRPRFAMDANGSAQNPDAILYYKYDAYERKIEEGYYSYDWTSLTSAFANDPLWPSTPATWCKKYTYDNDPTAIPEDTDEYLRTKGRLIKIVTNNDADAAEEVEETFTYDVFGRLRKKTNRVAEYDNQTYVTFYVS